MAVNSLCTAFRRVVLQRKGFAGSLTASYSTRAVKTLRNVTPVLAQNNYVDPLKPQINMRINFVPRTLNIEFGLPVPDGLKGTIVDLPVSKIPLLDRILPELPIVGDLPGLKKSLDLPPGKVIEKQATHLIIIRRKKMKKHKRQKMRKRIKAEWAKIKMRRELKREKLFVEEQELKVQEAQTFCAESYVRERLELYQKEVIPKTFRGEILPPSIVKKMLTEKMARRARSRNKQRLSL